MSTPDFKVRSRELELMDQPDVDPVELGQAMRHLKKINHWLNGYGPSLAGIKLFVGKAASFTLLDVGCGSGDTLKKIAQWARQQGKECQLQGIELSAISAERAAAACSNYPEITIWQQDLFSLPCDELKYDVVHSALVLHHFSDDSEAVSALRQMACLAQQGIIINDLHRHPLAWHSIRLLTRTFSASHILRNDAPQSVARAFTRKELEAMAQEAGLQDIKVEWRWAFRWLLTARPLLAGGEPR